jgi:glycosyltransferase involved in cell wall biosynthesis
VSLDSLYIAYWSLRDPLCQSQVLPILRGLAADGYRIGLMTFENPRWSMPPEEQQAVSAELRGQRIEWLPRQYHSQPPTFSTIRDILGGAIRARKERPRLVHGRGSVAAAVAYMATRGSGALFFNDADGPLSKEYVEAGIWRAGSPLAKIVARAEDLFLDAADANAVLTSVRATEVARRSRAEPTVLPCAVESELFRPRPLEAERIRRELSLAGTVFIYAGKVGGWYLVEPMMDFVAAYQGLGEATTLLVLTTGPGEPFQRIAATRNVACRVRSATREEVPGYLSAANVGLSFRLSTPSQRAASPVKNGEYLACGLPVVSTAGVGDYSNLIADQGVGVVVESLSPEELRRYASTLRVLLSGDATLARRCREAALTHAGLKEVVLPRYRALYSRLLGSGAGA